MIHSKIRIIVKGFKMTYIQGIHTALGEERVEAVMFKFWALESHWLEL